MRLCTVNGKKALFHRWDQRSKIVNPSPQENGQQGGTIQFTNGIIEYEDGVVDSVSSYKIVFKDTEKFMDKVEKEIKKWEAKKGQENESDEDEMDFLEDDYHVVWDGVKIYPSSPLNTQSMKEVKSSGA